MATIKIWNTKYALTNGILEQEGREVDGSMIVLVGSWNNLHGEGKEWHRTREAAVVRAEEMRLKKIESLKKQIVKLQKLRFEP